MNKLRVFVWNNFCKDWTSGLAVAIAHSEAEAKELVRKEYWVGLTDEESWGGAAQVYELDQPMCFWCPGGA